MKQQGHLRRHTLHLVSKLRRGRDSRSAKTRKSLHLHTLKKPWFSENFTHVLDHWLVFSIKAMGLTETLRFPGSHIWQDPQAFNKVQALQPNMPSNGPPHFYNIRLFKWRTSWSNQGTEVTSLLPQLGSHSSLPQLPVCWICHSTYF